MANKRYGYFEWWDAAKNWANLRIEKGKPVILVEGKLQTGSLNETIDYMCSQKSSWEYIREGVDSNITRFPNASLKASEELESAPYFNFGNLVYVRRRGLFPLVLHSGPESKDHLGYIRKIDQGSVETVTRAFYLGFRDMYRGQNSFVHGTNELDGKTVTIFNPGVTVGRPIAEYAALEEFCKDVLAPNNEKQEWNRGLLDAKTEEEANTLLGRIAVEKFMDVRIYSPKDHFNFIAEKSAREGIQYALKKGRSDDWILGGLKSFGRGRKSATSWCGLDKLFPDFYQRIDRIKEFIDDFFPGEIIKARKSYEESRAWLQSLKD